MSLLIYPKSTLTLMILLFVVTGCQRDQNSITNPTILANNLNETTETLKNKQEIDKFLGNWKGYFKCQSKSKSKLSITKTIRSQVNVVLFVKGILQFSISARLTHPFVLELQDDLNCFSFIFYRNGRLVFYHGCSNRLCFGEYEKKQ